MLLKLIEYRFLFTASQPYQSQSHGHTKLLNDSDVEPQSYSNGTGNGW